MSSMPATTYPKQDWHLDDWLAWIGTHHPLAMDFTLARSREVAQRLDVLKPAPNVVTVGGTNGKGSTVRLLEAALLDQGVTTGAITSPHLLRFNERIRIHGKEAGDTEIIAGFNQVDAARGDITLTYYEYAVLAFLWLLKRSEVEVAILEVGLGGRLDTVNLVDATVAVITSIGIDHVEILGSDMEAIGFEKAGIFRPHQIAVLGDCSPPTSVLKHAAAIGTKLFKAGVDFGQDEASESVCIGNKTETMPHHQSALASANVDTALATLHYAFPDISLERAYTAMRTTELLGRLTCHQGDIWLDVAHNPDAARHIKAILTKRLQGRRLSCLYATLKDKDVVAFASVLQPLVERWYLGATTGERGCSAKALAERMKTCPGLKIHAVGENFHDLCETAISDKDSDGALLMCGSFACVEQAAGYLNIAR